MPALVVSMGIEKVCKGSFTLSSQVKRQYSREASPSKPTFVFIAQFHGPQEVINFKRGLSIGLSPDLKLRIPHLKKTIASFQAKYSTTIGQRRRVEFCRSRLATIQVSCALSLSFAEVNILYFDTEETLAGQLAKEVLSS